MNRWIKFSMHNTGVIFLAMLMILAGGVYSVMNMKQENMPNVDIPYLSVVVPYPGANPRQALDDVGKPLEQALSGINNVKNLYVTSGSNYVAATLEFDMKQSMSDAEKDVTSALAGLKLPDGAQKPQISKQGPNAEAVYSFGITANTDQASIQQYVEDHIKPVLASVPGISNVDVQGQSEKKLYIRVDPDKMKEDNLSLDKIKQALQANNISIPAGQVTLADKGLNVEVGKKINSLDDAKNLDLIVVDQDMSSLTDAFKSVGDGFSSLGSSMGKLGQGVGNLTKGQMLLQGQIQLIQGINGLSIALLADQSTLATLSTTLAGTKDPGQAAALQQQIAGLNQKIAAENAQLSGLKTQLTQLQNQVTASGGDTASALQGLAGTSAPKKGGDVSAQPALKMHTIKLSDIADVSYIPDKDTVITRLNGDPAVVTDIYTQAGTNTVEAVNDINAKLAAINLPSGYHLTKLQDNSVQIKRSVDVMLREALLGALFAMLVTFLFLRNWRSTLVAILSIPLSIFASMVVLYWLDYSLNIMTLAGIAVAVGRVVDDSIVVMENIYRHVRTSEERSLDLVLKAAKEVAPAVTSSTITTVAVFGPMSFVPGIVGKFFAPFGITVVVSLVFSLLVAISVVPLLSRLFLLGIKHRETGETVLQRSYRAVLNWSLKHKLVIAALSLLVFAGSLALVSRIPQNFLPSEKTVSYSLSATMPVGTATEKTNQVATRIEQSLRSYPGLKSYQTSVSGENLRINIELDDNVTLEQTKKFEQDMQQTTDSLGPDVQAALSPLGITGYGGLFIVVNGPDLNALKEAGDKIVTSIKTVPGLANVKTNLSAVRPQLSIDVNPDEAAKNGLNPAMVALAVRQMINGDDVMDVTLDGRTTPVNLGLKTGDLNSLDVIRSQTLANMTGGQVKLSDVAKIDEKPGPTSIQRLNQQEYISVTGRFTTDNSSGVQKEVDARIKALNLPQGVSYYYEGETKAMSDGFKNMIFAMVAAIFLVYAVMMVAFGEMLAPIAILFSLPFIFTGGLIGLYLSGEALGMPALVGFLMLIGIVVTNAIVLMDRVLSNRKQGMDTMQALLEAGGTRLRPILMTAVATVGALLPLAVSHEGGLISRSLAVVVISGLTTSTILTLLIVPVAYQVLDSVRSRVFSRTPKAESVPDPAK